MRCDRRWSCRVVLVSGTFFCWRNDRGSSDSWVSRSEPVALDHRGLFRMAVVDRAVLFLFDAAWATKLRAPEHVERIFYSHYAPVAFAR